MASVIALLKVIAIDLILSGDNAIVIAMATRKLPHNKRNIAIFWGTGGAIVLRIIFASIIVMLLNIPLVHFFGGLLLLYIAYKVLDNHEEHGKGPAAKDSTIQAIGTIIAADAVMSLDNVVAVAGASGGSILILAFGVLISIPIMIFGSKLIVSFMEKYPWIAYVGSGILAWTAGDMIFGDKRIMEWFNYEKGPITYILTAIVTVLVLWLGYMKNKKTEPANSY
ncbi:TerC family protein [Bacillus massilinigeriensis]|uniref:TerC family protein n=1 Tax=Bacillus massilionigeriensis TaxID=1805475 RepID=UPI00096B57B3|nr:TerC family protein [Bacillus massilionigeriensis]